MHYDVLKMLRFTSSQTNTGIKAENKHALLESEVAIWQQSVKDS